MISMPALQGAFSARTEQRPIESAAPNLHGLIQRLQRGDSAALEPFIEETQEMAFRFVRSRVRDSHLCEDIVQDVYLIVYREIRKLRDPAAFRTWFFRILANRASRARETARKHSGPEVADHTASTANGEHDLVARLDLQQALEKLSDTDRTMLSLRILMDCSYIEIAEILRIPVGTVKSRLSEARRRLGDALAKGPPGSKAPDTRMLGLLLLCLMGGTLQ